MDDESNKRLEALKAKLKAREGVLGFEENARHIRDEIDVLEKQVAGTGRSE